MANLTACGRRGMGADGDAAEMTAATVPNTGNDDHRSAAASMACASDSEYT